MSNQGNVDAKCVWILMQKGVLKDSRNVGGIIEPSGTNVNSLGHYCPRFSAGRQHGGLFSRGSRMASRYTCVYTVLGIKAAGVRGRRRDAEEEGLSE